jgi:hypothetical protein
VSSAGSHPYGIKKGQDGEELVAEGALSADCLAKWDMEQWSDLLDDLEHVKKLLLRKDAAVILSDASAEGMAEVDEERAQLPSFNRKFQLLQQCLEMNKAIAPIRWDLEEQIRLKKEGKPTLDKKKVAAVV